VIRQLIRIDQVPRVLGEDCQPTVATSPPVSPSPATDAAQAKCVRYEMKEIRKKANIAMLHDAGEGSLVAREMFEMTTGLKFHTI
jgi:hypothetical protein